MIAAVTKVMKDEAEVVIDEDGNVIQPVIERVIRLEVLQDDGVVEDDEDEDDSEDVEDDSEEETTTILMTINKINNLFVFMIKIIRAKTLSCYFWRINLKQKL